MRLITCTDSSCRRILLFLVLFLVYLSEAKPFSDRSISIGSTVLSLKKPKSQSAPHTSGKGRVISLFHTDRGHGQDAKVKPGEIVLRTIAGIRKKMTKNNYLITFNQSPEPDYIHNGNMLQTPIGPVPTQAPVPNEPIKFDQVYVVNHPTDNKESEEDDDEEDGNDKDSQQNDDDENESMDDSETLTKSSEENISNIGISNEVLSEEEEGKSTSATTPSVKLVEKQEQTATPQKDEQSIFESNLPSSYSYPLFQSIVGPITPIPFPVTPTAEPDKLFSTYYTPTPPIRSPSKPSITSTKSPLPVEDDSVEEIQKSTTASTSTTTEETVTVIVTDKPKIQNSLKKSNSVVKNEQPVLLTKPKASTPFHLKIKDMLDEALSEQQQSGAIEEHNESTNQLTESQEEEISQEDAGFSNDEKQPPVATQDKSQHSPVIEDWADDYYSGPSTNAARRHGSEPKFSGYQQTHQRQTLEDRRREEAPTRPNFPSPAPQFGGQGSPTPMAQHHRYPSSHSNPFQGIHNNQAASGQFPFPTSPVHPLLSQYQMNYIQSQQQQMQKYLFQTLQQQRPQQRLPFNYFPYSSTSDMPHPTMQQTNNNNMQRNHSGRV